jgi:hypothetical protein
MTRSTLILLLGQLFKVKGILGPFEDEFSVTSSTMTTRAITQKFCEGFDFCS